MAGNYTALLAVICATTCMYAMHKTPFDLFSPTIKAQHKITPHPIISKTEKNILGLICLFKRMMCLFLEMFSKLFNWHIVGITKVDQ